MAPSVSTVLTFVPSRVWKIVQKLYHPRVFRLMDFPFKLSTKYTCVGIIVMMCIALTVKFVRAIEFECTVVSLFRGGPSKKDVTNFCWNMDPFLVKRGLQADMRNVAIHPGVIGLRDNDEIIILHYYKHVWMLLSGLTAVCVCPYAVWKAVAEARVKTFLGRGKKPVQTTEVLTTRFLEAAGFNGKLGYFYLTCKIMAALSPLMQWYCIVLVVGPDFRSYGFTTFMRLLSGGNDYPNPQDVLFPKIAKCSWKQIGISGDQEIFDIVCQLGMNTVSRWTFMILWWWLLFVAVVNVFSCSQLFLACIPTFRAYFYRRLLAKLYNSDTSVDHSPGNTIGEKNIHVNIGFGDHVALLLVKRCVGERKYRQLLRALGKSQNTIFFVSMPEIELTEVVTNAST